MSGSDASQQANRAELDPKRLAVVVYLVLGFVACLFLGQVLELSLSRLGLPNSRLIEGLEFRFGDAASVVVVLVLGGWLWTNPRTHSLSVDTATELMRVTWPSWDETRVSTIAVVVASLLAGFLLFGIDTLAFKLMVQWLPRVWDLL